MAACRSSARRIGLVILLSLLVGGCALPNEDLPTEILGRWATSEPRYADRFFEIQDEMLRFGTGGDDSEMYSIARVGTEPHPRGRLFRVTYLVDGEELLFAFHYDAANSTIRLHNQSDFEWTKAGAP